MRRWSIGLIVAALAALAVAPAALAGPKGTDRPFKATMSGFAHWEFPGEFESDCSETVPAGVLVGPWGEERAVTTVTESPGNATHMGTIMSYWSHCPAEEKDADGVIKLVAANGDELWGTYDYGPETCLPENPFTCTFDKKMHFVGGTGRFANATGDVTVTYGVEPVWCGATTEVCLSEMLDLGVPWPWWGTLEGTINM